MRPEITSLIYVFGWYYSTILYAKYGYLLLLSRFATVSCACPVITVGGRLVLAAVAGLCAWQGRSRIFGRFGLDLV